MMMMEEQASLFSNLVKSIKDGDPNIAVQSIEKFKKSQAVRFLDIAFIGPVMMYYGIKGKLGPIERTLLLLMGAGTIVYNYQNYKKNKTMGPVIQQAEDVLTEQIFNLSNENQIRDVTPK